MRKMHKVQLEILHKLLFAKNLRHSELKIQGITNSQFKFHAEVLLKENLIQKIDKKYFLTDRGKEFANRISSKNLNIIKQAKISVMLCCIREVNKEIEFLIECRNKNPFINCQSFLTKKVPYGESTGILATKALEEESGLSGNAILFGIRHFKVLNEQNKLLEDQYLFLYKFIDVKEISSSVANKDLSWVSRRDLKNYMTKPINGFWDVYKLLENSSTLTYEEIDQITDNY